MYERDAFSRMPTRLLRATGSSFLREISKIREGSETIGGLKFPFSVETEGMNLDRIKSIRARRVDKILTMLEKAGEEKDYEKAYEEVKAFNKSFPKFPILMSDINMKKIMKRKMRRYKKRALG